MGQGAGICASTEQRHRRRNPIAHGSALPRTPRCRHRPSPGPVHRRDSLTLRTRLQSGQLQVLLGGGFHRRARWLRSATTDDRHRPAATEGRPCRLARDVAIAVQEQGAGGTVQAAFVDELVQVGGDLPRVGTEGEQAAGRTACAGRVLATWLADGRPDTLRTFRLRSGRRCRPAPRLLPPCRCRRSAARCRRESRHRHRPAPAAAPAGGPAAHAHGEHGIDLAGVAHLGADVAHRIADADRGHDRSHRAGAKRWAKAAAAGGRCRRRC